LIVVVKPEELLIVSAIDCHPMSLAFDGRRDFCFGTGGPCAAIKSGIMPDASLLVVDDIEDNPFALTWCLDRGYKNVATAADRRQALEL
jgi:hypothetical protein